MPVSKQKNGKWLVQINRTGLKRVRKSFPTQKEAAIFEREYLFGIRAPVVQVRDPRRLTELIEIWHQSHGIELADPVKNKNKMMAAAHAMDNPVACMVTPELFIKYRYQRTVTDPKPVTKKTVNNIHGLISSMFNRLLKLKMIDYENPLKDVDLLRIQEQQMTYLNHSQIDVLFNAIKSGCVNPSTWYVANICIRTGARWGEAEKMKSKQLHAGRVTFVNTKNKKVRTIPLEKSFYNELKRFVIGKDPEERIFDNCIGSFRRAMARSNIMLPKGQMTHVLRHSFASHFMINNGNILTLKEILGHADIKVTMRYAHLAPNYFMDAIKLNPMVRN